MKNNQTFTITFTKQNGDSVTRRGKWTEDCREFGAQAGHKVLTFLDLDATAEHGKEQFRNATDKITTWSIK